MLACVFLYTLSLHLSFSMMRLTLSLDALNHGAGGTEVGILIGLISLCPMLAALKYGRWVDAVGPRKPVCFGALCIFCAALIPSLAAADTFGLIPLYCCALVSGLGSMSVQLVGQELTGYTASPKQRAVAFSWLAMVYSASGLRAPVVSGEVIDRLGAHYSYVTSLALAVAGIGIVLFTLRKLPRHWEADAPKKTANPVQKKVSELLAISDVRVILIINALVSMAYDLQNFMVPFYGHAIGLSAAEIGWLIGVFYAATFIVRFFIAFIAKHVSEWQFLTGTMLLGGAAYFAFPFFETLTPLFVVAFVLGLGLGASQPNVMSLLHSVVPKGRVGEALGVRVTILMGCHVFLPPAFGVLSAAVGVFSIFASMAALMGCAGLWLSAKKCRTQKPEKQA